MSALTEAIVRLQTAAEVADVNAAVFGDQIKALPYGSHERELAWSEFQHRVQNAKHYRAALALLEAP
jgi:hypothetical protein